MISESPSRSCPACGETDGKDYGTKNAFRVIGCRACGSLYTDRIPAESEAENYDEYYTESNLEVPAFIIERVREIVGDFAGYRKTNRFLDLGFGAGTMLEMAEELGWEPKGIEVSKPAVDQAKKRGFDVFYGGLRDAAYPDHSFDVIAASEILEHLHEPEEDLKEMVRILRPGGMLWATTPSSRALSFRLMKLDWSIMSPPEHIQLYSVSGARMMLEKAGFKKIRFKTYGLNPSEIKHHFFKRSADGENFSRVHTAYDLNERLMKNHTRRFVKSVLNETLNIFRLGDSLKIFAETA